MLLTLSPYMNFDLQKKQLCIVIYDVITPFHSKFETNREYLCMQRMAAGESDEHEMESSIPCDAHHFLYRIQIYRIVGFSV